MKKLEGEEMMEEPTWPSKFQIISFCVCFIPKNHFPHNFVKLCRHEIMYVQH